MPEFLLAQADDAVRLAQAEAESTAHAWSSMMYTSSLDSPQDTVWLMQAGGKLLGGAVLMQVLDEAHLQNFFVHAPHQGKGLGRVLLQHLLAQARQHGASCMFLEVRESNVAARQLYQRAGFEGYYRRKDYYRHADGQREDAILMKAIL